MAAFTIFIRKVGEEGQEVEVTPETTIGELKAQQGLKGYGFRFKGPWKDSAKIADIGIKAGETLNVCKAAPTPKQQAALRLKSGDTKKSTAHTHLNLHAATQGVVVAAIMAEGQQVSGEVQEVKTVSRRSSAYSVARMRLAPKGNATRLV